ncbi:hypothetical protein EJ08DRAFT_684089 [Tothia fuscella]|uniref:Uncharacterized protein n=1 Tax=Tothia fuscella TaxID=1048955 RepID=A0A9P4NEP8_9PEZI|nr:hypothetical protein EJ08DRAFT_684089 [Tothia fuscella]
MGDPESDSGEDKFTIASPPRDRNQPLGRNPSRNLHEAHISQRADVTTCEQRSLSPEPSTIPQQSVSPPQAVQHGRPRPAPRPQKTYYKPPRMNKHGQPSSSHIPNSQRMMGLAKFWRTQCPKLHSLSPQDLRDRLSERYILEQIRDAIYDEMRKLAMMFPPKHAARVLWFANEAQARTLFKEISKDSTLDARHKMKRFESYVKGCCEHASRFHRRKSSAWF